MNVLEENSHLDARMGLNEYAHWYEVVVGSTVVLCTFSYAEARAYYLHLSQVLVR